MSHQGHSGPRSTIIQRFFASPSGSVARVHTMTWREGHALDHEGEILVCIQPQEHSIGGFDPCRPIFRGWVEPAHVENKITEHLPGWTELPRA